MENLRNISRQLAIRPNLVREDHYTLTVSWLVKICNSLGLSVDITSWTLILNSYASANPLNHDNIQKYACASCYISLCICPSDGHIPRLQDWVTVSGDRLFTEKTLIEAVANIYVALGGKTMIPTATYYTSLSAPDDLVNKCAAILNVLYLLKEFSIYSPYRLVEDVIIYARENVGNRYILKGLKKVLSIGNPLVLDAITAIEEEYFIDIRALVHESSRYHGSGPRIYPLPLNTKLPQTFDYSEFNSTRRIGEGGYARVYQGILRGHDIALKIQGSRIFAVAVAEISVMCTLQHPNIEKIRGFSIDDLGNTYFSMSVRRSLRELLTNNTTPLMIALERKKIWTDNLDTTLSLIDMKLRRQIARELVSALIYIHSVGIIHNDIKPDNILLTRNNIVKLADFGRCLTFEPSDHHKEEPCTVMYRPIEHLVYKDSYRYFFEVDVWAAGITLLEMEVGCSYVGALEVSCLDDNDTVDYIHKSAITAFGNDGKKDIYAIKDKAFLDVCRTMIDFDPIRRATPEQLQTLL